MFVAVNTITPEHVKVQVWWHEPGGEQLKWETRCNWHKAHEDPEASPWANRMARMAIVRLSRTMDPL